MSKLSPSNDAPAQSGAFRSFLMAIAMIGVSEIGDKTFLIAALMSMRHSRLFVFSAAASSLAIMTVLSGWLGHTFVSFIPERFTSFLAGILFLIFGYKLTIEGLEMSKDAGVAEEMAEVEEEIAVADMNTDVADLERGARAPASDSSGPYASEPLSMRVLKSAQKLGSFFSSVWAQIFIMIFLGELGDRSQISIVALASDNNYWFTIFGAVIGHLFCTGIAVVGGRYLANKISMRTITLGGAFVFYIFAIMYIYAAFTH